MKERCTGCMLRNNYMPYSLKICDSCDIIPNNFFNQTVRIKYLNSKGYHLDLTGKIISYKNDIIDFEIIEGNTQKILIDNVKNIEIL